jgi:hypothetical protein
LTITIIPEEGMSSKISFVTVEKIEQMETVKFEEEAIDADFELVPSAGPARGLAQEPLAGTTQLHERMP